MNGDSNITIYFIKKQSVMILVNEILANPKVTGLEKDILQIEWYETSKSVLRRTTAGGREIGIKKNNRTPLQDGDVLFVDDKIYIQVEINPCDCIVITPRNMVEMGVVCFEIGNMHLPIYIDENEQISVAYEAPLYDFLQRKQYDCHIENRKLLQTQMLSIHQIKR
ncbi:MAG: urease accessory protein UreE [Bergeyella zoohelcum]|nr:urease accessory protein UreE [Bergeyella zoohelcum]